MKFSCVFSELLNCKKKSIVHVVLNLGGYDDDQEGNDGVANGGTGNGNDDDNGIDSGGGRGLRVGMRAMSDDQKAGLKKVCIRLSNIIFFRLVNDGSQ